MTIFAQTKVSGIILDEQKEPIPFASVVFKGSTTGTISDENGKFYLESPKNWDTILVSFLGYENKEYKLLKRASYNITVILKEESSVLKEVVIVSGKQSKKNNPAIDILRKIWKKRLFLRKF